MKKSDKGLFLHWTQSGLGLLFTDIIHSKASYGKIDYVILIENNITRAYITTLGQKEAHEIGKKLLKEKFVKSISQKVKKISSKIQKYKVKEINSHSWSEFIKIWIEFCSVYYLCEEPVWQPLEDILKAKYSDQEIINLLASKKNYRDKKNFSINTLKTMGQIKFDLHLKAENLFKNGFENFASYFEKNFDLKRNEFYALKADEVESILKGGKVSKKELEARLKGVVFFREKGVWQCKHGLYFKEWKKRIELIEPKKIKGKGAFPGCVRGKVIKHLSWTDVIKIPQNSVLVTGMTNPQMVPYLKNAVAIVTDEGGLMCHAAIISREFKIPCIVGTKNATKLLKDGDLVEVDANKGIVKILK